ncbi:hypothetical protein ACFLTE_02880 [Bacteroidota bacterium]
MAKFNKDGRLLIPLSERKAKNSQNNESKVRYILSEAYCKNGCNIIDKNVLINGYPGLRIKFKREGVEGEFVLSAIEGDFDKEIISGHLKKGLKDELFCPHCGVMFETLVNCNCKPDTEMIVIGLTPHLDYNNAITFCNVTGCANGTFIKSGDAIKHVRLGGSL